VVLVAQTAADFTDVFGESDFPVIAELDGGWHLGLWVV